MPPVFPIASSSTPLPWLLQSADAVQSNDLLYRGVLDVTAWDIHIYMSARNKDEQRERFIEVSLNTICGFIWVPISTLILNHLVSHHLPQKNKMLFNLPWSHLDAGQEPSAMAHLNKEVERIQKRLKTPSGFFDQQKWVQKQLALKKETLENAITHIAQTPNTLKKVYKAKQSVLIANLLLSTLALSFISPTKQFITKVFAHKDRFTGSQNYLSDEDSKKLTNTEARKKQEPFKLVSQACLVMIPATVAWATHHRIDQAVKKGQSIAPWLLKIRNSMDYTSGIYLSLGGLFAIFMANNVNDLVWARDQYERLETFIKYCIACPSFFYGDRVFNGNLAKVADKALSRAGHFKANTFIEKAQTSWLGGEAKFIQQVVDDVSAEQGEKKAKQAGNVASLIFLTGFAAHSLGMTLLLNVANALTKRLVIKDLSTLKQDQATSTNS